MISMSDTYPAGGQWSSLHYGTGPKANATEYSTAVERIKTKVSGKPHHDNHHNNNNNNSNNNNTLATSTAISSGLESSAAAASLFDAIKNQRYR